MEVNLNQVLLLAGLQCCRDPIAIGFIEGSSSVVVYPEFIEGHSSPFCSLFCI
jgi:hypothetical protein